MPLSEYSKSSKEFIQCPKGTWPARIYQVIELGTQTGSWNGEPKMNYKVRINWEVFADPPFVTDEGEEKPYMVGQTFTLSFHENANLRGAIEDMKGEELSEEEMDTLEIWDFLGMECLLTTVLTEKDGKTYANIHGYTPLIKGVKVPKTANEPFFFSFRPSMFTLSSFERVPKTWQEKIKTSPEYGIAMQNLEYEQRMGPPPSPQQSSGLGVSEQANFALAGTHNDVDIPF